MKRTHSLEDTRTFESSSALQDLAFDRACDHKFYYSQLRYRGSRLSSVSTYILPGCTTSYSYRGPGVLSLCRPVLLASVSRIAVPFSRRAVLTTSSRNRLPVLLGRRDWTRTLPALDLTLRLRAPALPPLPSLPDPLPLLLLPPPRLPLLSLPLVLKTFKHLFTSSSVSNASLSILLIWILCTCCSMFSTELLLCHQINRCTKSVL